MRVRKDPWRWPVAIGTTAGLWLAIVFLVPAGWIDFLFTATRPLDQIELESVRPWLTLMPPPEIEILTPAPRQSDEPPPPPLEVPVDPDWWTRGMRVRVADTMHPGFHPVPTLRDTMNLILSELNLVSELTRIEKPDSVLAAALILLEREDSFRFDELKPYLKAVTRSRAYADIMSRAADMYDEHLGREVMVPD